MWNARKRGRAIAVLREYGRPHRRLLLLGSLATIGIVLFRLALPWPLRGVVEVAFPEGPEPQDLLVHSLPGWGDPVLWLAVLYLLFAAGCGVFEALQRVLFSRFAAQSVHGLRRSAVRGILGRSRHDRVAAGELVARAIGDTARVKAGLNGILVHWSQNALLFLGITAVLLCVSFKLGMIFAGAGTLAILIGWFASHSVAENAHRHRAHEGRYAAALQDGVEEGDWMLAEGDSEGARQEVKGTRLVASCTLAIHVILALTMGAAMWWGTREVQAGILSPGGFFLFIAYMVTAHRRLVQVGRQTARSGKVLACAHRIAALLAPDAGAPKTGAGAGPVPLRSALRLEDVKVASARKSDSRPRLRRITLDLAAGSRVAVLGGAGAGKSSFLELISGRLRAGKGKILWDGAELDGDGLALADRAGFLSQGPVFPPIRAWKLLGLASPGALSDAETETLRRIGALKVLRRFPRGLEQKVSSRELSTGEARALCVAGLLLRDRSAVWALDDPLAGMKSSKAARRLGEILRLAEGKLLVAALSDSGEIDRFDRVLELHSGKIVFDGAPAAWREAKAAARAGKARPAGGVIVEGVEACKP